MSKELIELSNALAQATDRAATSVVAIHTERRGSSSGVVWRRGVIVTSEHALRRDEEIQLTLPNGRIVSATLAGRDPSTDIAVLKCAEADNAVPEFGDVATLKPGSLALVVGRTRARDRKSTRLNSSHSQISYAVFCLKKKNIAHSIVNAP